MIDVTLGKFLVQPLQCWVESTPSLRTEDTQIHFRNSFVITSHQRISDFIIIIIIIVIISEMTL